MGIKPRERILRIADELFYTRGVRAVGVDEIVARSQAAKASLYAHFPTKDALIAGYLQQRSDDWRAHLESELRRRGGSPVEQIDHVFEVLTEDCDKPGFRGCPFINAAVEFPDPKHPARTIVTEQRRWVRTLLSKLVEEAHLRAPEALVHQLAVLYDAAMVGTQLDGNATPAVRAREAARTLVDAARPGTTRPRRSSPARRSRAARRRRPAR